MLYKKQARSNHLFEMEKRFINQYYDDQTSIKIDRLFQVNYEGEAMFLMALKNSDIIEKKNDIKMDLRTSQKQST